MLAYHVCECTTSVPAQPPTISRSTPRVRMAALASASPVRVGVAGRPGLGPLAAEAVHPRVDPVEGAQRPDQLGDVDAGTAVDVGRVLPWTAHRSA